MTVDRQQACLEQLTRAQEAANQARRDGHAAADAMAQAADSIDFLEAAGLEDHRDALEDLLTLFGPEAIETAGFQQLVESIAGSSLGPAAAAVSQSLANALLSLHESDVRSARYREAEEFANLMNEELLDCIRDASFQAARRNP